MALEQPRGDRPARQAAGDDARHRRSDRHAVGRGHTGCGELRRKSQRSSGATGQRRGADEHTEQRRLAEGTDDGDTDHTLQDGEKSSQRQKEQRLPAPRTQQRETRAETDGREERSHQGGLQGRIQCDRHARGAPQREDDQCDQQAADNRGRNVVPGERGKPSHHRKTCEQRHAARRQGLNQVECQHAVPPKRFERSTITRLTARQRRAVLWA